MGKKKVNEELRLKNLIKLDLDKPDQDPIYMDLIQLYTRKGLNKVNILYEFICIFDDTQGVERSFVIKKAWDLLYLQSELQTDLSLP